ncbi:hypothetical protein VD0004_g168 [Verticillium dahliae]|uniref:Integral membrane protein n=1 Tax=Verticillium dahliae TaxID=27337 RepID=A0A444S6L0_VERDA|nr:hypothetical protein VD0004_g168 [Verticillium dahliae]PNH77415.1 hypothetical protein VD0001_g139 [Verticillium dahliae]RXG49029.1 hypothetical protein VDGE_04727 [Verticillium dahliae]
MLTLLPDRFVLEEVTEYDMIIASLAWGFTLGIGWLTTWSAIQQTRAIYKRRRRSIFRNAYVWMIWGEILVCLGFGIICFMYLLGLIPPSFAFYFCILTLWALQVQFLLQIIINRCAILLHDKSHVWRLKYGVAFLITAINISVYCIWVPARLQISETYIHVNLVWDRCEKVIYLLVDACLNFYFVRIVQQNLVQLGLRKYSNLVRFNMFIIIFSLSMDVLIIAMMSLNNTFVYMQFHPLAYIVKLKIEMSMADLIAKIARKQDNNPASDEAFSRSHGTHGTNGADTTLKSQHPPPLDEPKDGKNRPWATVTTTVEMHTMKKPGPGDKPFSHKDTDTLIDQSPTSSYIQRTTSASGGHDEPSFSRGGGGSMSSYESMAHGIEVSDKAVAGRV